MAQRWTLAFSCSSTAHNVDIIERDEERRSQLLDVHSNRMH